jgi:hypothetical protein
VYFDTTLFLESVNGRTSRELTIGTKPIMPAP